MKADSRPPIRIRARDVREVTPWQLPDMSAEEQAHLVALAQRQRAETPSEPVEVKVVEEEIYAEKLTLEQWEAAFEEARIEGQAQGREEGLEAGRQEGFEQGLQQGLEEGRARIEAEQQRLSELLTRLQRPLEEQQTALENLLVGMVTDLARAVVQAELSSRPELIRQTVAQALACLPPATTPPVLRLHPEDCARLAEQAEREGWELVEDASLTPGSCILDAGSAHVDASVENRFAQVAQQLQARLLPGAAEDPDDAESPP